MTRMTRLLKKKNGGFTLIELMIVVVIIGILAATAIPAFVRFVKRSKTGETSNMLKALFTGASAYYGREATGQGYALNISLQSACVVQNAATGNPIDSDKHQWIAGTGTNPAAFTALEFASNDLMYYQYRIANTTLVGPTQCNQRAAAGAIQAVQTFMAIGDLDADTITSQWEMACGVHHDTGYGHAPVYFSEGNDLE